MPSSSVQQQAYWTRRQEAQRHFIANELALGLDLCSELDNQADLNDPLRALVNMDVLQYCGHVLSYLEKMRFIEHCHSLMAGIEQRMGADDEDLIWLKQNFEQVKGKLDLSRASPELGREVSITSGEAVSSENEDDGLADDEQDGPGVDEMDNTDEGERKNSGDDEKDESGQVELNECGDDEMGETEEDSDKTTDTEEDAMDEIEDEADDPGQAVMPIAQTTQYGETGPWEGFND